VHVLQIVETDDADHGDRFQRLASKLETSKHCETFCEYNYSFHCSNCGELCAGRYEKTKLVEDYTEYLSACCQASLELRENES
jgi:hypothetical protein